MMTHWLKVIPYDDPPMVVPPVVVPPKTFTQSELDSHVAAARRLDQAAIQKHTEDLRKLQASQTSTAAERAAAQQKLQEIEDQFKTAEERRTQEIERQKVDYDAKLESTSKERDEWKKTFQETTITTAIVKNATDAVNPELLEDILTPKSRVVADVDKDGKPTGKHTVMAKIVVTDSKTKATVTIDAPIPEVITAMKGDVKRYGNLFKSTKEGGTGTQPTRTGSGATGVDFSKMSDQEYAAYRRVNNLGRR